MPRLDDALARTLDFGDTAGSSPPNHPGSRAALRLAAADGLLRNADKYKVLEKRRRQAQIKARHALGLTEMPEGR
jgi:hypothetical protein